jgi:alpha-glucosidase
MMRPLYFLEPGEPRWREDDSQFLLGDSVLVAPVLKSMASEAKKTVRLPAGAWYDGHTLARLDGARDVELTITLDTLPFYFREGAIIPIQQGAG